MRRPCGPRLSMIEWLRRSILVFWFYCQTIAGPDAVPAKAMPW